jgi:hypothetical protein
MGRRRANATYFSTHEVDISESAIYAMDLTPLVYDSSSDISEYVSKFVKRFEEDVKNRVKRLLPNNPKKKI